jgi:hypothetical protein
MNISHFPFLLVVAACSARVHNAPNPRAPDPLPPPRIESPVERQQQQAVEASHSNTEVARCIEPNDPATFCLQFGHGSCVDAPALYAKMSSRHLEKAHLTSCELDADRYSVVSYRDPLGAMEFFFNGAGVLVAARHLADTNKYCDRTSLSAWFGTPIPKCSRIPEFRVSPEGE